MHPLTIDRWLQRPAAWLLLMALGAAPLIWPDIPPLGDLPGHIGRYAVQTRIDSAPELQQWYSFRWALIPNLGVDLLVQWLHPWLGVEGAAKLVVCLIPPLQILGWLWLAREAHGRVPVTALFALPLAYAYPFQYGFVNWALAVMLATLAAALWLRLGRQGRLWLRAAIFVPVACIVWIAHIYGWGVLVVLAGCTEWMRRREAGQALLPAGLSALPWMLPLAAPYALRALAGADGGQGLTDWRYDPLEKLVYVLELFHDRFIAFDVVAVLALLVLLGWAARSRMIGWHSGLALAALAFLVLFGLLPRRLMGSFFADMRLVPTLFATAILAIRPVEAATARLVARLGMAGLAFFAIHQAENALTATIHDTEYDEALALLPQVPRGARLATFVQERCEPLDYALDRRMHLGGLALARRHAFSNEQWEIPGGQLLSVHYPAAGGFQSDSSKAYAPDCADNPGRWTLDRIFRALPAAAFDYVWVIGQNGVVERRGWTIMARNRQAVLYRREGVAQ